DEIVGAAFDSGNVVLFLFAIITAGLTAFYIFRLWFLTFLGERRLNPALVEAAAQGGGHGNGHDAAGPGQDDATAHGHGAHGQPGDAHESPWVMTVPMMVLAFLAIFSGFAGSPLFHGAFQGFIAGPAEAHAALDLPLAAVSTGLGLLGILIAWGFYGAHWFSAEALTQRLRPIYLLLLNKYYMDDIYNWLIGKGLIGLSSLLGWFDQHVVDGIVNAVAWLAYRIFGWIFTRAESGELPNYALGFFVGVLIIAAVVVGIPLGH
ncbi:MAG: hypothetical protein ACRDIY_19955, partial [Chloroflexota bacterium]